jgi:serine protease Do
VVAQDLDEHLASYFHAPPARGALISEVNPKGPASKARFRTGDVVLRFNGEEIKDSSSLKSSVAAT